MNSDLQQIYEESFPANERREWNQLIDLLKNDLFTFNGIYHQQQLIGLITFWDLNGFCFIEHFAIRNTEQGKGYGTQVIKLLEQNDNILILEVEEPFTEIAKKRISFYARLNFSVNEASYFQPAYSIEKNSVKLLLMSYPQKINFPDFENIKIQIHDQVYGFTQAIEINH